MLSLGCPHFTGSRLGSFGSEVALKVELHNEEGVGGGEGSPLMSCQVSPILNHQFKY